MIVVDNTAAAFGGMSEADRLACLHDARRVLRDGGRIEFIERDNAQTGIDGVLAAAGFKPVRTLAERDGFRFVEGLKA
jgi:16S rRNA G1207 methylase RsmC